MSIARLQVIGSTIMVTRHLRFTAGALKLILCLNRSLIFQKKHFWFGTEPVESKNLTSHLVGEKPEAANHNVSWASHTGKGLLFFSKKAAEKTQPAGLINLVRYFLGGI